MKRTWLLAALGVALAVGFTACKREPETVKLGIAGPMTGAVAKFGEQLKKGGEWRVL